MSENDNIQKNRINICEDATCCQVEAVVTIDKRGQIILPKEVRQKAGMKEGDKFAVISCGSEDAICCVVLVSTDKYTDTTKNILGPLFS